MKEVIVIAAAAALVIIGSLFFDGSLLGSLVLIPFVLGTIFIIRRSSNDSTFLIRVFVSALVVRMLLSAFIVGFEMQGTFGEDAISHEAHGLQLLESWTNGTPRPYYLNDWNRPWGLHFTIASFYSLFGRVPIVVNFIGCFVGALTAVLVYFVSLRLFGNRSSARIAMVLTAYFPAMIIWSAQIMKDGYVIFFIVLTMFALLRLQERFSVSALLLLGVALTATLSFRFYIFYFAVLACLASIVFGNSRFVGSPIRYLGSFIVIAVLAAYFGFFALGTEQVERLSNLEALQSSRSALSSDAASGYSADTDIRSASGVVLALPVGLLNLIFAPFPWQVTSLRSALALPEMFVWWALIPSVYFGIRYTLKSRFRTAIPILVFTIALTFAYAVFQTNVGTAYRQRTQIQVFMFIFVGVGLTIRKEEREDARLLRQSSINQLRQRSI